MLVGEDPDVLDGLEQLADPAVGEGLALEGDEDGVGGGQPVDGQHPERRWTVDQDQVVVAEDRFERPLEHVLAAGPGEEVDLRAGQVDGGGEEVEVGHAGDREPDVGHLGPADEDVVDRLLQGIGIEPQGEGEARLGVEVHHQGAAPELPGGHPQRLDGGRLGHPALLVGNGEYLGHPRSLRGPGATGRPVPPAARRPARSRPCPRWACSAGCRPSTRRTGRRS